MQGHGRDVARSWWRKLLTVLSPAQANVGERLAQHYTAEVRLARFLAQEAESLTRYPHQSVRVLGASKRAGRRAQRITGAFEGLAYEIVEPITMSRRGEPTVWERVRASILELGRMSETYLADAYAMRREHPDVARLLLQLREEAAADERDLVWTLAQLDSSGIEAAPARVA